MANLLCECGGPAVSGGQCQGCINHFEGYHAARVERHARYMRLADEAWAMVQRLWKAMDIERNGPFLTPRWDRLFYLRDRAESRHQRRVKQVRELGMDEESMQRLDTGQQINWRGAVLTVTNWHCNRDPVFGPNSRRLWAEPVFCNEQGQSVYIAPVFWHELIEA